MITQANLDKANAADRRLRDAAPELLAALQEVVAQPHEGYALEDAIALLDKCRAAIKKAKGETP
jgi:hypothetical protein